MGQSRPFKVGDLVRLRDTGAPALIISIAKHYEAAVCHIKIHTGEFLAPWKLDMISKVEERRER